jgi:hypothetical protein
MIMDYMSTSAVSTISINVNSIDSINIQGVKSSVDDNLTAYIGTGAQLGIMDISVQIL